MQTIAQAKKKKQNKNQKTKDIHMNNNDYNLYE